MMARNKDLKPVQKTQTGEIDRDWRLIIAAPLPSTLIDRVTDILKHLASQDLPIRWVAPGATHLTLHFIGEVPPERGELLKLTMNSTNLRSETIRLRTDALGVFPDDQRPRVIWLGLRGQTDKLNSLNTETGRMIQRLGFSIESHGFKPHITLGRVRDNPPNDLPKRLFRAIDALSSSAFRGAIEFEVDQVNLYRSHLEPSGPRYEVLASRFLAPVQVREPAQLNDDSNQLI